MNSGIKNFSEFRESENLSEGLFDGFKGLFDKGADAVSDVIKGKVVAYLLEMFGIKEGSSLSKVMQNFVEQIPIADLVPIVFKGKVNAKYLAPKAADATIEFLTEKGLDGIATEIGIEPNGLMYRTISELLTNEIKRENFRKNLGEFYLDAFNGFKDADPAEFEKSLTGSDKSKMERELKSKVLGYGKKVDKEKLKGSNLITDFLSQLTSLSGANSSALGDITGNKIAH